MALTPERIAELERLKAMMQPAATDAQRKAQAIWNAEQMAKQVPGKKKGGLEKFLEPSKVKQRMFHGTNKDIQEFKPAGASNAVFLAHGPDEAHHFAHIKARDTEGEGKNIMPVYAQVRNAFDYENPEHMKALREYSKKHRYTDRGIANSVGSVGVGNWEEIERKVVQDAIKHLGHDAFYVKEGISKNLGVYDPRKIKSAIGNRGTYDPNDPDITKADGGEVSTDAMRMALMNKGGKPPRHKFVKHKHGEQVGGYHVGDKIKNYGSYASSGIDDIEQGIHRVPMSAFEVTHPNKLFYAKNDIDHVHRLAEQIKQNKYMDPLLVAMDEKGPYVLEGGHRLGAAHLLGMNEIPAMIGHEPQKYAQGGTVNPFDYENPEHVSAVAGHAAKHKDFKQYGPKMMGEVLSTGHHQHLEDPRIQHAMRQAGHNAYHVLEKTGKTLHKMAQPVVKKAMGGQVQPSIAQMKMALNQNRFPSQAALDKIGAEEAPNMPVKAYVPPAGGQDGQLPVGGIDMSEITPGMQYMPEEQQAMQPPGQPGQTPQPPMSPSAGPSSPGQQSNILQMTPQGQAMAAMQPTAVKPQMASGGPVPVQNHPFQTAGQKPIPFMAKVGGSDNMPMDNQSMDNGATTFDIDNIQELAKGGSPKPAKSLHYEPAPSLSKKEIQAMADRMARQMAGVDNPNQKTLQQLAREQNLPIGIKSSKKMDVPIINYEDLKGSYSVGVPGDTSRGGVKPTKAGRIGSPKAGEYLTHIGGEALDNPVGLFGGKDYGAYGHPAGWASDLGASAGMFNLVKKLAEENPERQVYGHYHKMSPEALNHAVHMLDAVISHHKPHASPSDRISMLNDLMRNKATTTSKHDVPYPEFPGFENPADIMLQGQMNSGMRKKIIGLLGKEKYFPGGKQKLDDIIYAISHPELRNIETGAGGSSIIKFDPSRNLKESISPHPTYGHDIPSKLVGRTRYTTPVELLAPRSMANAKREIAALGKKVVPFNHAKMNIIREPIDEQYINQLGEYELAMKKRLGYKKGGKASSGKLSDNLDTMRLALTKKKAK
jgi:hypothetical protein